MRAGTLMKIFYFNNIQTFIMNTDLPVLQFIAMNNSHDCISVIDARLPGYPGVFVNQAFCCLTGYRPEELIGRNCLFLHGTEEDEATRRITIGMNNGQTVQEEIIQYKKDATPFWNRLCIMPFFSDGEGLTHFICIHEDVTVQKETALLEREKANLDLISKTTRESEEKQRREIGEELHDNVNQLLAVTKLYMNIAMEQPDKTDEMLAKGKDMLLNAMEEIRKLSRQLTNPEVISSLENALSTLRYSVQEGVSFALLLNYDRAAELRLTAQRKMAIYRIIQEQINNIIKYANPTVVVIDISATPEAVQVSVKDNGVGFNAGVTADGIGLKNMRSRAETENGSFTLTSGENEGCEIRALFPCSHSLLKAVTPQDQQQVNAYRLSDHPGYTGKSFGKVEG